MSRKLTRISFCTGNSNKSRVIFNSKESSDMHCFHAAFFMLKLLRSMKFNQSMELCRFINWGEQNIEHQQKLSIFRYIFSGFVFSSPFQMRHSKQSLGIDNRHIYWENNSLERYLDDIFLVLKIALFVCCCDCSKKYFVKCFQCVKNLHRNRDSGSETKMWRNPIKTWCL